MINVSRRIYQIFWNPKGLKKKKKLILELFSRGHIFIVLSCSVMSNSLQPHGLQPTRLLCPWRFSRQEYWSGLRWPPPRDLPNTGIEPRSPAFEVDSFTAKPPGRP